MQVLPELKTQVNLARSLIAESREDIVFPTDLAYRNALRLRICLEALYRNQSIPTLWLGEANKIPGVCLPQDSSTLSDDQVATLVAKMNYFQSQADASLHCGK